MRIGAYEVEGELGRGAMGRVLRARHVPTGAVRALKVLDGPLDAEGLLRFRREAETLARVGGPGVVSVHDSAQDGRTFFYAMDLMPGGSLGARLKRAGRLEWREAVALGAALARTLARCHGAGVIHRDLKPDNILFDEAGAPRIADFGCARDLHAQSLTLTGAVIGTPAYMAPEQLLGQRASPAADVFALGAILHELVTGERPHQGRTLVELHESASTRRALHASDASGAPRALDGLLAGALDPAPERRPDAASLAADLERLLAPDAKEEAPSRVGLLLGIVLAGLVVLGALVVVAVARRPASSPPGAGPAPAPAPPPPPPPPPTASATMTKARARELVTKALADSHHDPFSDPARALLDAKDVVAALEAARSAQLVVDAETQSSLLEFATECFTPQPRKTLSENLELYLRLAGLDDEPTLHRAQGHVIVLSRFLRDPRAAALVAQDAPVLVSSPDSPDDLRKRGFLEGTRALAKLGRGPEAIRLIESALQARPKDLDVCLLWLTTLLETGRAEDAFREAEAALGRFTVIEESSLLVVRARYQFEVKHDANAALAELQRLPPEAPTSIPYCVELAAVFADRKQLDTARLVYRHALALAGDDEDAKDFVRHHAQAWKIELE